jgi:hypothetical protein
MEFRSARPALRSKAWMREPRLRSEPISERISSARGVGGGGALRSCSLRASSAETTTGPTGTNPLSAAATCQLLRLQLPPFHPPLRRNAPYLRFRLWLRRWSEQPLLDSAGELLREPLLWTGCLRFFAETFVFACRAGAFLKSASGAARIVPGALEAAYFSIKLSDYF